MDPVLITLCKTHGVFLRREATALGYSKRAFDRLVASGEIRRVRSGAYTLTAVWEAATAAQRHLLRSQAAYRRSRTDVVLSHTSSLAKHLDDWWDLPLDEVHLTRWDGNVGRCDAGVRQHAGVILAGDVEYDGELAFMSATRTALEIATMVDFERALVVANTLLHAGMTTKKQLEDRSVEMYQWPGTLNHELVLRHCDHRMESVGEIRTWCAMRRGGVPLPEPQWRIYDDGGRLFARLDFAWPELGVWLEFDGKKKYLKFLEEGETPADAVLREKRRERTIEEMTGWICVRVEWADLANPERLAQRIFKAFRLAAQRRGLRIA